MLKFSELTLPQKTLIKEMRQGHILKYSYYLKDFVMTDGKYTWGINRATVESLINRKFISECFRDKTIAQFCVNIEIEYGKYLDEHNNLIGC
jgi:hypothetical protein